MLWLSLVLFLLVSALSLEVAVGSRKIRQLKDFAMWDEAIAPRVSIIIPALNEAGTIEVALNSVLAIDYPNLEIIVVNDRSTDGTAGILERMREQHPSLQVMHIDTLPQAWLEKNHALQCGAQRATGEYLLFTDADVLFAPSAISRAVNYCEAEQADHLTLLFDIVAKTRLLAMLVLSFSVNFMARFKPWKIKGSTKHFVGAGGFNLVRLHAYRKIGGHASIPMAVLDDLMLGKLLKQHGCSQHILYGRDMVGVEWYRSAADMMHGLRKNAFAAFDFRISQLVGVTLGMLALRVWPWLALFFTDGAAWWLNLFTVLAGMALYLDFIRTSGWSWQCLVYAPIVALVELAIWWRGSIEALLRGGVEWRGTFYPLSALRHVRL